MNKARSFALFLLAFVLVCLVFTTAQAHAMLVRSTPGANASLLTSPTQVELFFSEAVTSNLSKISVMDSSGKPVDSGNSRVDPADATHVFVSLQPLADGVYMVVWKVISATDGHQTSGSFPFSVGKVDPGAMAMAGSSAVPPAPPTPIGEMIVKGFLYMAAAALMGGILFTFLVWNPSILKAQIPPAEGQAYTQFNHQLAKVALIVLVIADVLSLMMQAGLASGTPIGWPWQSGFASFLLGTRVGILSLVQLALAGILAGLLLPPKNSWNRWVGLVFCLFLLLTFSLESHAAGEPHPFLPVLADWVHMTAVSVWVGGLFSFLGGMWLVRNFSPEPRTRLTSILIPHFTILALTSVGVLILTGTYATILHVGTVATLFYTEYGRALILKLLMISPMLALGAINFLITTPNMRRAATRPGGRPGLVSLFSNMLTGEASLGILVLIWVGVFTLLPPAKVGMSPVGLSKTAQADDLTVKLTINPGSPGINTFTAAISSAGQAVTNAQDVSLEFTSVTGMVPPAKASMTSQAKGRYTLQGGYLGMPDKWDIKVVVIRPGKFDAYADFKFDLSQQGNQAMP